jgi:hypothetical protein
LTSPRFFDEAVAEATLSFIGDYFVPVILNDYPTNLIARMLHGCGLRVSERLNLRREGEKESDHSLARFP